MDYSGGRDRPGLGRRPSIPSPGTPTNAKEQVVESGQRPKEKIAPFHNSPIVTRDGAICSKLPGTASGRLLSSPGSLFQKTPGWLIALPVRERLIAAAERTVEHVNSSGSSLATAGAEAQASLVKSDDNLSAKLFHLIIMKIYIYLKAMPNLSIL